jgi:putative transposase
MKTIKKLRLPDYDYSAPNSYFITICTHYRRPILAEIIEAKLCLTPAGQHVSTAWQSLHNYTYVRLDSFVIMPDHIHGIISIEPKEGMKAKELSQLVGAFKAQATSLIKQYCAFLVVWQPGFYEHVIRNEADLERCREYIELNPMLWLIEHGFEM